ncbi:MAG TPA: ABC transporter permease [Thermoanaerobaculia bacterium]|nr:ABC transporter permease [Thermoanaerobaculia bacterium]
MPPTTLLESFRQDLTYAARSLVKSPGFTIVAALSLALGIGANTAIFSLISALILRPLPVAEPSRLVAVGDPSRVGSMSIGTLQADLYSYPMYRDLRDQNRSFSGLFASGRTGRLTVGEDRGGEPAKTARGRLVSGNYFSVLGVRASRGRTLNDADERALGAAPYVVISDDYWRRKLDADPNVLGRQIKLNGSTFGIVGVAEPGFFGDVVGLSNDVYIPLSMQAAIQRGRPILDRWDVSWLLLMGRLKPGVSIAAARTEINGLFGRILTARSGSAFLAELLPQDRKVPVAAGGTGFSRLRSQFSRSLFTLMAIVGLVLLIASANVANLLLERSTGRQKEISVRLALGAGRVRLVRQLLTESLLLALLGAGLGVLFATWADAALLKLVAGAGSIALDLHPDRTVLAFTALVALLTGLMFGLVPALRATRPDLAPTLKENARAVSGGGRWSLGRLLVVAQFAVSLLLLVGAGLFVGTLRNLERLDLGYDREGLLMLGVDLIGAGVTPERHESVSTALLDRLRAVPGVLGASASENGVFSGTESGTTIKIEGFTPGPEGDPNPAYDRVAARYFETVGIPILRGRGIGPQDRSGSPRVAVINRSLAEKYFAGRDPIGRHFTESNPGMPDEVYQIVGIAGNARDHELRGEIPPRFYQPMHQSSEEPGTFNVEIRTARPAALKEAVRKAVRDFDPNLPIEDLAPLSENIADSIVEEKMIAQLSAMFGALALLLASIGLYGVVSYAVARRTHELGIRMAIGAQRAAVLWLVLRETLFLALVGIAVGVPAALAATRIVASRLVGLSPTDPATLAVATGVLMLVALVAGAVPGARATRVDPVRALRSE